jgi:hypothetical protein
MVARIAGELIGAGQFLPTMANDEFLSCLSRSALEKTAAMHQVAGQKKLKDTRSSFVKRFAEERFVHPAAEFAPAPEELVAWAAHAAKQVQMARGEQDAGTGESAAETSETNAFDEGEDISEENSGSMVDEADCEAFENDLDSAGETMSDGEPPHADKSEAIAAPEHANDGYAIAAE